jgi:proteasome lid subunit RPN8/RPN11
MRRNDHINTAPLMSVIWRVSIPAPLYLRDSWERVGMLLGSRRVIETSNTNTRNTNQLYIIRGVLIVPNVERSHDGFGVTRKWMQRSDDLAAIRNQNVIGLVHSHPDDPDEDPDEDLIAASTNHDNHDTSIRYSERDGERSSAAHTVPEHINQRASELDVQNLPDGWLGVIVHPASRYLHQHRGISYYDNTRPFMIDEVSVQTR